MALVKCLKKGDSVMVITGRSKGKTGKVLKIDRTSRYVFVEGINVVRKTQKPSREGEKGSIVDIEAKLSISNVMLKCPKCGPVRILMNLAHGDVTKTRICRKCRGTL